MNFNTYLRKTMGKYGILQRQLAEKMGIETSNISMFLKKKNHRATVEARYASALLELIENLKGIDLGQGVVTSAPGEKPLTVEIKPKDKILKDAEDVPEPSEKMLEIHLELPDGSYLTVTGEYFKFDIEMRCPHKFTVEKV